MKELAQFQSFDQLWREHVTCSELPRMHDDQIEQDFWQRFMAKKTGFAPSVSSRQVVSRFLLPKLQEYGIETALEWGPGWGNYTIPLAKSCRQVDCVDISRDVLSFLQKIGREEGCENIRLIQSKWEDYQPERTYDLVFGYNCFYRQADLAACLLKMNRAAKKLCVAGMDSGLAPIWTRELAQAGMPNSWEWKDYPYFAGTLYQLGIFANVTVLPYEQVYTYKNTEELLQAECSPWAQEPRLQEKAMEILGRHFTRLPDGSRQGKTQYHSGIVWWTLV